MIDRLNKHVTLRELQVSDRKAFTGLTLKQGDTLELYNMLGITGEEYLKWHFDEHMDITRGFFYKGKLVGFICITNEGNLCFLTTALDKHLGFVTVKYFNRVLQDEMCRRDVDKVFAYVDTSYTKAYNWVIRGGFVSDGIVGEEDFKTTFELLTYYRQNVAN